MRLVKPDGPRIYTDRLYGVDADPIPVGSERWHAWLATATTFYFRAGDRQTWHRARREVRRGQPYWYVACRVGGRMQRFYLGPPSALDGARLVAVAAEIATARAAPANPSPPVL
jgi:hypothetical protein